MSSIKLIAMDIGGTLITDDNQLLQKNINMIQKAKKNGIIIALITARMYSSTKYISKQINADFGIFANGSSIIDLKKKAVIYQEEIPKEKVLKLITFGKERNLYIHLNGTYNEYSDKMDMFALKHTLLNETYEEKLKSNIKVLRNLKEIAKNDEEIIKVVFVSENSLDDIEKEIKEKFKKIYITEHYKNLNEKAINKVINYIELGFKNTNKSIGLINLLKKLNISEDEVLVIGDGDNDGEMFKQFKNSGCLKNGSKNAKENAKYITNFTNNEAGVADIIEYFLKGDYI